MNWWWRLIEGNSVHFISCRISTKISSRRVSVSNSIVHLEASVWDQCVTPERFERARSLLYTLLSTQVSAEAFWREKLCVYTLPASKCTWLQFVSNKISVNTAAPWFTCDRRTAQSSPNEKRVQQNTHRLPLAAVKSHCCQKRERRWMWRAFQTENSRRHICHSYKSQSAQGRLQLFASWGAAGDETMRKHWSSTDMSILTVLDVTLLDNSSTHHVQHGHGAVEWRWPFGLRALFRATGKICQLQQPNQSHWSPEELWAEHVRRPRMTFISRWQRSSRPVHRVKCRAICAGNSKMNVKS